MLSNALPCCAVLQVLLGLHALLGEPLLQALLCAHQGLAGLTAELSSLVDDCRRQLRDRHAAGQRQHSKQPSVLVGGTNAAPSRPVQAAADGAGQDAFAVSAGKSAAQPQASLAGVQEQGASASDEDTDYLAITVADAPKILQFTFPLAAAAAAATAAAEPSGCVRTACCTYTAEEQALMRELDFLSRVANIADKTVRSGRTYWRFQVHEGRALEDDLYGELRGLLCIRTLGQLDGLLSEQPGCLHGWSDGLELMGQRVDCCGWSDTLAFIQCVSLRRSVCVSCLPLQLVPTWVCMQQSS